MVSADGSSERPQVIAKCLYRDRARSLARLDVREAEVDTLPDAHGDDLLGCRREARVRALLLDGGGCSARERKRNVVPAEEQLERNRKQNPREPRNLQDEIRMSWLLKPLHADPRWAKLTYFRDDLRRRSGN
jgi:hypothetical protein